MAADELKPGEDDEVIELGEAENCDGEMSEGNAIFVGSGTIHDNIFRITLIENGPTIVIDGDNIEIRRN